MAYGSSKFFNYKACDTNAYSIFLNVVSSLVKPYCVFKSLILTLISLGHCFIYIFFLVRMLLY